MTFNSSSGSACAACKFQRRKCTSACLLAPYFPAEKAISFRYVHKLFGVSNVIKLLKMVDDSQRKDMMDSIVFEAHIRSKEPIYGSYGVLIDLEHKILQKEEELKAILVLLERLRSQRNVDPKLELGMASSYSLGNGLPLFPSAHFNSENLCLPSTEETQNYNKDLEFCVDPNHRNDSGMAPEDNMDSLSRWIPKFDPYQPMASNLSDQPYPFASHTQVLPPLSMINVPQNPLAYSGMFPHFECIEQRPTCIDPHSSNSSSSKQETIKSLEKDGEKELESAAACFTLTRVE